MANAPIGRPKLFQSPGTSTPAQQRATKADGGNTFVSGAFVTLVGATLVAATAAQTGIYGLSIDASHASTDEPYTAPFGENHNPLDPTGALFVMNVTAGSGEVGSGSTKLDDVFIGRYYHMVAMNTGDTLSMGINAASSSLTAVGGNIFQIVDKLDAATYAGFDAATDYNGRVVVKIAASGIQ